MTDTDAKKIICIVGPTSSGKTAVAVKLANRLDGEVVSCDSMQIYRDMDVITQAPSEEVLCEIPYHLVRIIEPEEEFSAARYTEEAGRMIDDLVSRGKTPIFTGGTGLYLKALLDGIFPAPAKDEKLREKYARLSEIKGGAFLHDKLKVLDPKTAAKLHPNDLKRIIRALEVSEQTGKTMSEMKKETAGIAGLYDIRMFGLKLERDVLYDRINAVVEKMFDSGLVSEVEGLLERRLSKTASKALGIKEVAAFLSGNAELDEAKEELKRKTRNYAKRQLTWFRADKRITWIGADRNAAEIAGEIIEKLEEE